MRTRADPFLEKLAHVARDPFFRTQHELQDQIEKRVEERPPQEEGFSFPHDGLWHGLTAIFAFGQQRQIGFGGM